MANKYGSIFPSVPLRTKSGSETYEATVYSHKFSFESLGQLPAPSIFFWSIPGFKVCGLWHQKVKKRIFCHFSKSMWMNKPKFGKLFKTETQACVTLLDLGFEKIQASMTYSRFFDLFIPK